MKCALQTIENGIDDGWLPATILAIGRTDATPINNEHLQSNAGLARARVDWVGERLRARLGTVLNGVSFGTDVGWPSIRTRG